MSPLNPAASGASPAPGQPPGASLWTRHTSPDGRPYWSHPQKGSVWEKPSELKSAAELEVEKTPWKEYETGGRKYWVHAQTKETTWAMPKEISDIVARFSASPAAPTPPRPGMPPSGPRFGSAQSPPGPGLGPGPAGSPSSALTPQSGALVAPGGAGSPGPGGGGASYLPPRPASGMAPGAPMAMSMAGGPAPVFVTHAEAEAAFKSMLARVGVDASWTWEMVMKECITEPYYKALKTLAERKAAFEHFLVEQRAREREEMEKSLAKCRDKWNRAMDRIGGGTLMEDGVKSWWSWERGKRVMQAKCIDVWKLPRNDEERRILFTDFVNKLRTDEETRKREMRGRNMDKLTAIFQSLQLDLAGPVRWQDARGLIMRTPEWHRDPELQQIEPIDMITVFEDEVQRAEKEQAEVRSKRNEEKRRKGRRAREGFRALLEELVQADQIAPGTTWKSVYPLVAHDERYLQLLGLPGSTPLDLFWDRVDDLDVRAEENQLVIEAVAKELGVEVQDEDADEEDFFNRVKDDRRLEAMDYTAIRATFQKLKSRAVRAKRDERRRAEKRIRLLVDDLRYALKKVDPPIDVEVVTYEHAVPLVSETEEWKALEGNDEARVQAWDKFVRRQREKRAAEMDRVDRDRLYERERDAERERDRQATRRSRPAAGHDEPMEGVEGAGEGGGGGGALAGDVRRSSRTGLDASQLPYDDSGEGRRAGEGGGRKRTASDRGVMEGGAKDSMDAAEGAAVGPAAGDDEAGRDGARGPDRKVPRLETAAGGGSADVTMSLSKDREEGEL
ncbi:U1 snRNP protein [Rhodotorula sphaerocarpa]